MMSSPTTTEVTNVVEMAYAWEFKRPPGGPNAKHLTLLYLSRSINDNITAVPAPRLWPVTTRGKSGYSTYALSRRCFSRICKKKYIREYDFIIWPRAPLSWSKKLLWSNRSYQGKSSLLVFSSFFVLFRIVYYRVCCFESWIILH